MNNDVLLNARTYVCVRVPVCTRLALTNRTPGTPKAEEPFPTRGTSTHARADELLLQIDSARPRHKIQPRPRKCLIVRVPREARARK